MGIFSKKSNIQTNLKNAYRCYKQDTVGMVFPGGFDEFVAIIRSYSLLLNVDFDTLSAISAYELSQIYTDVFIRHSIVGMADSDIAISLTVKHPEFIHTDLDARRSVAFYNLHRSNESFCKLTLEKMPLVDFLADAYVENREHVESNKPIEKKYINDKEYGLIESKPLFSTSIVSSKRFINSLYTSTGEKPVWERRGSVAIDEVAGPVDIYDGTLPDGTVCGPVYISVYGTSEPNRAPAGFALEKPKNAPRSGKNVRRDRLKFHEFNQYTGETIYRNRCVNCGKALTDNDTFCPKCGLFVDK